MNFSKTFDYTFDKNGITIVEITGDKNQGEQKVNYKDIVKVKQTKIYLFLYTSRITALPILKSNLQEQEIKNILDFVKSSKAQNEQNNN